MHELSLAGEVIRLAEYEAEKNNAVSVSEISIEIGSFSGVETDAFGSALSILSEGTILAKTHLNLIRIPGRGYCDACRKEFDMNVRIDTCPECGAFPSEIRKGNEFKVVSLVIEEE